MNFKMSPKSLIENIFLRLHNQRTANNNDNYFSNQNDIFQQKEQSTQMTELNELMTFSKR